MMVHACQLRPTLGAVDFNLGLALDHIRQASSHIVVFPELFLTGYPPTDLMFSPDLNQVLLEAYENLKQASYQLSKLILMGCPYFDGNHWRNAVLVFANGQIIHKYYKQCLPNYDVFNDTRYFVPGKNSPIFTWEGKTYATFICEDVWANRAMDLYDIDPIDRIGGSPINAVFHLSASPFEMDKMNQRITQLKRVATTLKSPVFSINQVGGYADILFDGQSMVLNEFGEITDCFSAFEQVSAAFQPKDPWPEQEWGGFETTLKGIQFGLKEYMSHTGFSSVLVGLSGGIDSALVLAIAVLTLGPEKVTAVSMPTQFNSSETKSDARQMAENLGCHFIEYSIEECRLFMSKAIKQMVLQSDLDPICEQNTQARCRGLLLMGLSNQTGNLLLTTGNKSELAMGYATLYGDMCGGLNIIGDLFKTDVFALANYINDHHGKDHIPKSIIQRPPSAELAPNQRDDASLPPYDRLDKILTELMIENRSLNNIRKLNDNNDVNFIVKQLERNEFKRFQSPPILKLSSNAFGRGWQYPLIR